MTMVTGDYGVTAEAIARVVGLVAGAALLLLVDEAAKWLGRRQPSSISSIAPFPRA